MRGLLKKGWGGGGGEGKEGIQSNTQAHLDFSSSQHLYSRSPVHIII